MQKQYAIQFYKTINKLLCNLSFAGQYICTYVIVYKHRNPRGDAGGLSREYVLRIPSVS